MKGDEIMELEVLQQMKKDTENQIAELLKEFSKKTNVKVCNVFSRRPHNLSDTQVYSVNLDVKI